MKEKLAFAVLYALLIIFLTEVNCIKVDGENITIASTPAAPVERNETTLSFSLEVTSESDPQEARTINDGEDDKLSSIHKIPPTLQNAKKVDAVAKQQQPEKSLKDIA
jgi:hypothetical protein